MRILSVSWYSEQIAHAPMPLVGRLGDIATARQRYRDGLVAALRVAFPGEQVEEIGWRGDDAPWVVWVTDDDSGQHAEATRVARAASKALLSDDRLWRQGEPAPLVALETWARKTA